MHRIKRFAGDRDSMFDHVKPVLAALALIAVGIAILNGLLDSLGDSPQLAFALSGSFAVYLGSRPTRRQVVLTILLGCGLRLAYGTRFAVKPYCGSAVITLAGFLGLASLLALVYTAFRTRQFRSLGTAAYFPLFSIMVGFILPISYRLSPATFDTRLLAVDGTLGFQPSFVLGSILRGHPLLWNMATTLYWSISLVVALVCALQMERNFPEVRRLLYLFAFASGAGFVMYAIFPATGPVYAFPEWFPAKPPRLPDIALGAALSVPGVVRNAMPSLHVGAALLVVWNVSHLGRAVRSTAALYLAATAFIVLALGEHYLIDIVVAVPFALLFQAAFADSPAGNSKQRHRVLLGSAATVAGWILTLRYGVRPLVMWPAITWAGAVATIGLSAWARHKLTLTSR
jgi:hypothetical protein